MPGFEPSAAWKPAVAYAGAGPRYCHDAVLGAGSACLTDASIVTARCPLLAPDAACWHYDPAAVPGSCAAFFMPNGTAIV